MKLIKINTDHYVVVDDLEIKEGDWIFNEYQRQIYKFSAGSGIGLCKKITHSTDIELNEVYYIPLSEVKELIGEVDVEKKAKKHLDEHHNNEDIAHPELYDEYNSFIKGYNQALENNKDKKYTEDDMRKAIKMARRYPSDVAGFETSEIIQSLKPKTEWEVEFIDGKLKLK